MATTSKKYWETQVIDRYDRGLLQIPFFRKRVKVIGCYLIQRQVYETNRLARIMAWDVYKETDLMSPIMTFATKKAAIEWVEDKLQTKLDI